MCDCRPVQRYFFEKLFSCDDGYVILLTDLPDDRAQFSVRISHFVCRKSIKIAAETSYQ